MNRRSFLQFAGRAIVAGAALRAVPLETLQRYVPGAPLRDYVALAYLRREFNKYCDSGKDLTLRVPALIVAGYETFDMAECEIMRMRDTVYTYPGIPNAIMFKGCPMIRNQVKRWHVEFLDADQALAFAPQRRDDSSF